MERVSRTYWSTHCHSLRTQTLSCQFNRFYLHLNIFDLLFTNESVSDTRIRRRNWMKQKYASNLNFKCPYSQSYLSDGNPFDLSFLCSNYRNHIEILLMTPVNKIANNCWKWNLISARTKTSYSKNTSNAKYSFRSTYYWTILESSAE